MKCPYCNRVIRDMPDHLRASSKCSEKHKAKLRNDMRISKEMSQRGLSGYRGQ
jgi:uncharacterized C2H2 Zn-finger protein